LLSRLLYKMLHKTFRYEQVVNKIEETISGLQLQPGDKVPSVRKVSNELKVSLTTVKQAYGILEAKGVIISRPGSGFYINTFVKSIIKHTAVDSYVPLPEFIEVNTMAAAMVKNTQKFSVINFSSLAPVNEYMPISRINKAMQASVKEENNVFQYSFLEGHPRLIKQVALHSFDWDHSIKQDEILITNGCMEAISLCLDAVTNPGDIVAIESPAYAGILQCLESKGLKALGISVDPITGLNLDELELALAANKVAACLFMPVCQNPYGCSMPEGNKIRLVKLLGEKNIPLIEDDALGELSYEKARPLPAKAYDTYNNVLFCSSFSKSLVPGFRIGWVAAGKYQAQIERLKFAENISTNGLLQDTIGRFLESGQYNAHIKKLRQFAQSQTTRYRNAIIGYFPEEVKISTPAGGYSLWIELPANINALEVQREALKFGIGFCPGQIFSASNHFQNFMRINCCPMWSIKIDGSLKTLGNLVHKISKQAH
jgi:DNA-binding transcriptional MocR family regulator